MLAIDTPLRVLVIGVSGNVSIGILKALKKSRLGNVHTYGACIHKYSAGFGLSDEAIICPLAFSDAFPEWLRRTTNQYDIDVVISGVEEVNYMLSKLGDEHSKACYLSPEFENVRTFYDKLETANWLKKHGIDHPITVDLDDPSTGSDIDGTIEQLGLPLIVKPKIGKGSKGVHIVTDKSELATYAGVKGSIAQQLIGTPQSEYTCGVYKSKFGYTKVIVMRRLLSHGSTAVAEVVSDESIEKYCRQIADAMNTTSPFNVQLRVGGKTASPHCFEVNMRLSGTTSIRHSFGFPDCEVWIREQYYDVDSRELFDVVPGVAIRFEEEVYFKARALDLLSEQTALNVRTELLP